MNLYIWEDRTDYFSTKLAIADSIDEARDLIRKESGDETYGLTMDEPTLEIPLDSKGAFSC